MASPALDEIQQDGLAMSVAWAVAVANEAAVAHGVDPEKSLVTITEESTLPERCWRVHYGPRDYVRRRGGDLIVVVDGRSGTVQRVLRGQ